MKYKENILECIGHTPLIKLSRIFKKGDPLVLAKAEFLNPGGSVKDRIGLEMIKEAEDNGLLKEGGIIIEPTSGNTGHGLAMVSVLKGYRMIFTMPDKMSKEKELLLNAYGGEVLRTRTDVAPDDPESYYKVAERVVRELPGSYCPNQYYNNQNPLTHYKTTGPEIWNDCPEITHFVCGMGTGGTITGVGKYLKEQNSNIKIIGVDVEGSIYYDKFYGLSGEGPKVYKTEGIGEDFIPQTIDLSIIDEVIKVNDRESYQTARLLARKEALLVGSSSGAAAYATIKLATRCKKNSVIVVLFPDTGRNYMSKIFNDEWMEQNNLL